MNRKIVCLFFIVVVFIDHLFAQTLSQTIRFDERVYSFGTIEEAKGPVTHTFVFTNTGTTPMEIADVHSSCGCIGKLVSKAPVKPGAKGKVTITFDPSYKAGFFSKEILVFSKGGEEYNRIWVEGNIIPAEHPITDEYPYDFGNGLYLRLKVIAFGYMKPGETKQIALHYANDTDEDIVLSFITEGLKAGLQYVNPGKVKAKHKGVLYISYSMPFSMNEDVVYRLNPYVNHKKLNQAVEVKILNEIKRIKENQLTPE